MCHRKVLKNIFFQNLKFISKKSSVNQQQCSIKSCAETFERKHSEDPECLMRSDGFSLLHAAVTLIKSAHIEPTSTVRVKIIISF